MIDRRLLLIGLPVAALSIYFASSMLRPTVIEFTRAAPPAPDVLDLRPAVSTAFLDLPVDLTSVARRTQVALEQRLASPGEQAAAISDSTCARRPTAADCALAPIGQNGAITIETQAASIKVKIPVRIDPSAGGSSGGGASPGASGSGGARAAGSDKDAAERGGLDAVLAFQFTVRPSSNGGFELTRRDDVQPEGLPASLSATQSRMLRQVEARLRPVALTAHDELRQVFNALPVANATQAAWSALSQPFELGKGSGIWLKPVPELVGAGQLVSAGGRATFRIPIAARLSIDEAGRGTAAPKRPVIQGQILTQSTANIRIATSLSLEPVQSMADAILVKNGAHSMKPDRFGPPIKIEVHSVKTYPSVRQIAFALDLSASRYEGQIFRGQAHFVARPELEADARIVSLADVALTALPSRETGAGKVPQNAPRLGSDPIAGSLAKAVRLDISREIGEAVPRYSGLLHQRLGERLSMAAHIVTAQPIGIETSRSGLWLLADLNGTLSLTYDGPGEVPLIIAETQNVAAAAPSATRRPSAPESAPAAVVAGAVAGVAALPPQPARTSPATAVSTAQPSAGSAVSIKAPAALASDVSDEDAAPAKAKAPSVKAKVLSTKPKVAAQNSKVAAKQSWVPFPQ